jgi:hypothetical protein
MGIMDEIKAEQADTRKGPACGFVEVYKTLHKPDADELRDALGSPAITASTISRVLARHGLKVQSQTVNRHRRGECTCERV